MCHVEIWDIYIYIYMYVNKIKFLLIRLVQTQSWLKAINYRFLDIIKGPNQIQFDESYGLQPLYINKPTSHPSNCSSTSLLPVVPFTGSNASLSPIFPSLSSSFSSDSLLQWSPFQTQLRTFFPCFFQNWTGLPFNLCSRNPRWGSPWSPRS